MSYYLLVLLLLPLVGYLVVATMGGAPARTVKFTALGFSLVEFAIAVALWIVYQAGPPADSGGAAFQQTFSVPWISSFGIHFSLGVDGMSLIMIALIAFLTPIVLGFSWEERLPAGRTIGGYFALVLLLECTLVGVFAATDVFLFYVFFEVMLIPMYFLIGYFGGPRRAYAAMKFFLYSLVGGLLMLASVIGLYVVAKGHLPAGTMDWATLRSVANQIPIFDQMWIFGGFFVAFAIKAPLVPLHTWLPDAGAEAPTGTSTLLVTVMDKVGTFGLLRICLPLLPGASQKLDWLFLLLAVFGILYAAVVAAGQTDLKRFVTYTSIAHFGFIAMGIFAFTHQSITGAMLYMLNHGISTALLFIIVGMLITRGGSRQMRDYGGVWKVAPMLGGVFMVATMATVALPGTNSFISEFLVLLGTFDRHIAWGVLGTIGIIFAAVYMLWVFQQTMTGPVRGAAVVGEPSGESPLPAAGPVGTTPAGHELPLGGGADAEVEPGNVAVLVDVPVQGKIRARFGDLTPREIAVVTPLVAAILFLGIYPQPVLNVINPTATATVTSVGITQPTPVVQEGGR